MGEHVNKIREEVADMELLVCTRVWEAWHYGTMSEDDFMQAADDTDAIQRLADIARTVTAEQVEAAAERAHAVLCQNARAGSVEIEVFSDGINLERAMTRAAFEAVGMRVEGGE